MDELAKGEDQDDGYPPEEGFQLYTLKRRNKKKIKNTRFKSSPFES